MKPHIVAIWLYKNARIQFSGLSKEVRLKSHCISHLIYYFIQNYCHIIVDSGTTAYKNNDYADIGPETHVSTLQNKNR